MGVPLSQRAGVDLLVRLLPDAKIRYFRTTAKWKFMKTFAGPYFVSLIFVEVTQLDHVAVHQFENELLHILHLVYSKEPPPNCLYSIF